MWSTNPKIINQNRGSVLILSVAVLVLLVLIGTAYIQAARSDRNSATGDLSNTHAEEATQLQRDEIVTLLNATLVSSTSGAFLDDLDDENAVDGTPGVADNPGTVDYDPMTGRLRYDYPHPNVTRWLASTAPVQNQAAPARFRWVYAPVPGVPTDTRGNITNVTNLPSDGDLDGDPATSNGLGNEPWVLSTLDPPGFTPHPDGYHGFTAVPDYDRDQDGSRYPTDATDWNPRDIAVDRNSDGDFGDVREADDRADADGDGITDSRFIDSPLGTVNGRRYVIALRIVDLSALLNVNVATAQTDALGNFGAAIDAPRWLYPSELDMANFVFTLSNPAVTQSEFLNLLQYRVDPGVALPLPMAWNVGNASRESFWLWGPSMYGNFNRASGVGPPPPPGIECRPLTMRDEIKLRLRNGLNSENIGGTTIDQMPVFIRDVPDPRPAGAENPPNTFDYETGYAGNFAPAGGPFVGDVDVWDGGNYIDILSAMIGEYFAMEPRHQMTTLSGSAIYAPGQGGPDRLQVDLNNIFGSVSGGMDAIRKVVFDVYQGKAGNMVPAGWAVAADFSYAFAAAVADYRDGDNQITRYDISGTYFYGFEALPFITEVYVQGAYEAVSSTLSATPPNVDVQWNLLSPVGYAIEIRNPFNKTIRDFNKIHLVVGGVEWGSSLEDVSGVSSLGPGDVLILYRDNTVTGNPPEAAVTNLWLGFTVTAVQIAKDWPVGGGAITVELRAELDDVTLGPITFAVGNTTTYIPYVQYPSELMPNSDTTGPHAPPGPVGQYRYRQVWSIGNGNGLNMITVDFGDVIPTINPINDTYTYNTSTDKLGESTKTGGPADVGTLAAEQIVWRDDAIWSVAELALIPIIPQNGTQTTANGWADQLTVSQWTIDFNPVAGNLYDPNTAHNNALPYAVMLLDRFTTLSPADDGVDNDGDGVADNVDPDNGYPAEAFVPGRININTVAGTVPLSGVPPNLDDITLGRHLLQRVLPIPDPTVLDNVIEGIINYRDNLVARPGGVRTGLGIASLGELALVGSAVRNELVAAAGDNPTLNGIAVDFNPDPPVADGVGDDLEEQLMPLSWLSQVLTVRTDRVAVYGLIRGYNGGVLSANNLAEESRFIMILDRSGMTDGNDKAKVLAIITY